VLPRASVFGVGAAIEGRAQELQQFALLLRAVRDVLEDVSGELKEIADDVRFADSPRGRFVLFCNDYSQELYKIIRSQAKFVDAYIGAHLDREAVVVQGHVPDEAALHDCVRSSTLIPLAWR
jgi:hypothetical protein